MRYCGPRWGFPRKAFFQAAAAFVALAFFAAAPVAAQTKPAASAPSAASAGKDEGAISFSARRMESVLSKGKEKTVLIGQALVTTGTLVIKAERIELSGEDYNEVLCTGAVSVLDESKGFLLKSAKLKYARDTEIGLAQDQVVLEDSKNDILLKADWLRFDQKQSLVDARIGVHILKEDFAARAEFVRYNRDDESLQLSGSPVAVTEDGTIVADTITGKAGADSLEFGGNVSGTITTTKKDGTSP